MAAASDGIFRKRPALDYYFRRAHRTGDEHNDFEHPFYDDTEGGVSAQVTAPAPVEVTEPRLVPSNAGFSLEEQPEAVKEPEQYAAMKYPDLRALARKCDPNAGGFGVKRAEYIRIIEAYVKEHGHVPDGE